MSDPKKESKKISAESMKVVEELSELLNTGLTKRQLGTSVKLIEEGVSAEALKIGVSKLREIAVQNKESAIFNIVIKNMLTTENADIPELESKTALKVRIKKWHAVAGWKWTVNDECCGICRMPFIACCADCKTPGDDCPLVWGRCTHPFHMHCIVRWLDSQHGAQLCPLCRQEWKFSQFNE